MPLIRVREHLELTDKCDVFIKTFNLLFLFQRGILKIDIFNNDRYLNKKFTISLAYETKLKKRN